MYTPERGTQTQTGIIMYERHHLKELCDHRDEPKPSELCY